MRGLILCGDKFHPAENVHRGLSWVEDIGVQPDWVENPENWPSGEIIAYPIVILAKSNHVSAGDERPWMTMAAQAAFAKYVRQGGGLLAIHSGIAGYEEDALIRGLLGGVFSNHPPQCPVTVSPKTGHPMTTGMSAFTLPDEHYFVTLDDLQVDVFLTSSSQYGQQPAGWRRSEGSGRVAVLTPGHNLAVWQHMSYKMLIANIVRWCLKLS